MTMHLMGPQFTTTNTRKPKSKNKTKSQIQAELDHEKFLKRMGVHPEQREQRARSLTVKHPPYTRLDVSRLESDPGSNPGGPTNSRSVARSDQVFYDPSMAKKEEKVYTGERKLLGIATMHKSNLQPIWSKEQAKDAATMRRS